jgi:hypothetical protein
MFTNNHSNLVSILMVADGNINSGNGVSGIRWKTPQGLWFFVCLSDLSLVLLVFNMNHGLKVNVNLAFLPDF